MSKLWGGRFEADMDALMEQLNASIGFDRQMYEADIRGSQAYARALVGAGILTETRQSRSSPGSTRCWTSLPQERSRLPPMTRTFTPPSNAGWAN